MATILFTNKYTGKPLRMITECIPDGFKMLFLDEQTQENFIEKARDAEYILAGGRLKITETVLNEANKLKMIQRSGVGLDALDLEAIKKKGIPLYVNQGVNAESVAEHALLLMLACLRRLTVINTDTKNGIWKKQEQGIRTRELKGKTVGIIGMGNIAKTLVRLLKPFEVAILYVNIEQESPEFESEYNMKFTDLENLLHKSDVISVHCALNSETRHLFNKQAIADMKDGAILVNTSRGEVINTEDIVNALLSGKLSFAALDVYEDEPIAKNSILKNVDNVILTPHIAGVTEDSFKEMMVAAFRNIDSFEKGRMDMIQRYRYL